MKKYKSLVLILASLCMSASIPYEQTRIFSPAITASAVAELGSSGSCGETASYVLDEYGRLTITGYGAIDDNAFQGNMNIFELVISEGITSIGNSSFKGCKNMVGVYLPDSLKTLGTGCFSQCSFERVIIPDQVTLIGSSAFFECKMLSQVQMSDSVTNIGDSAFSNCRVLKSINLSNNLTYIGTLAFDGCFDLEAIEFPDGLEGIGACAFGNCVCLTSIVIPESVRTIGFKAFSNCQKLEEIVLPKELDELGEKILNKTPLEEKCYQNGEPVIIGNHFTDAGPVQGEVIVPEGITTIAECAFKDHDQVTSVELPETVQTICANAFENCTSLENIYLPENLQKLGRYAFRGCSSLKSMDIPQGISMIEEETFKDCISLESLCFSQNVKTVEMYAFLNCSGLKTIQFKGDTELAQSAFENCPNIEILHLSSLFRDDILYKFQTDNITEFIVDQEDDGNPFRHYIDIDGVLCNNQGNLLRYPAGRLDEEYTVPEEITTIYDNAFQSAKNLKVIKLPEQVSGVYDMAFMDCQSLQKIMFYNHYCSIYGNEKTISNDMEGFFTGTIHGYRFSDAERYADQYAYHFEALDDYEEDTDKTQPTLPPSEQKYVQGDANGDGSIDILDVISINKVILGKESFTDEQLKAIDFNKNNRPDAEESLMLLKYIVGLIDNFDL